MSADTSPVQCSLAFQICYLVLDEPGQCGGDDIRVDAGVGIGETQGRDCQSGDPNGSTTIHGMTERREGSVLLEVGQIQQKFSKYKKLTYVWFFMVS